MRNAAFAANARPSWAPWKKGRAALGTAIAASAVTMVTLWASVACGKGRGVRVRGGSNRGRPSVRSVLVSPGFGVLEKYLFIDELLSTSGFLGSNRQRPYQPNKKFHVTRRGSGGEQRRERGRVGSPDAVTSGGSDAGS